MAPAIGPMQNLHAACLFLAPAVLALSSVLYAAGGGINDDPAGGAVQVMAFPFFIIAFVALTDRLSPRSPRAAAVLLFASVFGCVGGVAYGVDSILVGTGGQTLQTVIPWGTIALNLPGTVFPLAMLAIGILSAVQRTVPVWAGVLLAVAAVSFVPSRIMDVAWLALISDAMLLVALGAVALHSLRHPISGPRAVLA